MRQSLCSPQRTALSTPHSLHELQILYVTALSAFALSAGIVRANILPLLLRLAKTTNNDLKKETVRNWSHLAYFSINVGATVSTIGSLGLLLKTHGTYWGYFLIANFALLAIFIALLVILANQSEFKRHQFSSTRLQHSVLSKENFLIWRRPDVSTQERNFSSSGEYRQAMDQTSVWNVLIVGLSLIVYGMASSQIINSFSEQSHHLNIYETPSVRLTVNSTIYCNDTTGTLSASYKIPPSFSTIFNAVAILVFVPVVWRLAKIKKFKSPRIRIGLGYVFALVCMLSSVGIEVGRRCLNIEIDFAFVCTKFSSKHFLQVVPYSDLTVLWQCLEMILLGLSEAFSGAASMEFFFSIATERIWCITFGIYNFVNGFGSLAGLGITSATNHLVYDKSFVQAHFHFVSLSAIMIIGIVYLKIFRKTCSSSRN
eukprot:m.181029 g.181029  ORF g.181029 m.181029 type:complete len:428 (+) comp39262_c0_seq8:372-1655(+)